MHPVKSDDRRYIFVSGGVLSGLGKGIASASIGLLLKSHGFRITPVKCENYLNIDAGLINPIEHGDPFLCEDGTESDMDLGTYERFLNQNMGKRNFVTMGQIYKQVIEDERSYRYHGEDVEAIPHVVSEIIRRIKTAGDQEHADIVLVELGGTAGEYQNALYYEAARQMELSDLTKNGGHSVIHIHISYLPIPKHLGEPKTKPTQLSIRILMGMGIQPDFLIARSEYPIDKRRKYLLGITCNIKEENIISDPDADSIYEVPLIFHRQDFDQKLLGSLELAVSKPVLTPWISLVHNVKRKKRKSLEIAIVGKYFKTGKSFMLGDSYAALFEALKHASWTCDTALKFRWISAEDVEAHAAQAYLMGVQGVVVPIGWGNRGAEGKIKAIRYAREHRLPYLGLCYGMQLACVEFARNVLGMKRANTTENDPHTPYPVIHDIPEREDLLTIKSTGVSMRLGGWDCAVKKGSILDRIYQRHSAYKDPIHKVASIRHRHRFEFNNEFLQAFEQGGLTMSAMSVKGDFVDCIELPTSTHPFFLATQGHPEYSSRPLSPHPIFVEFIAACNKSG